MKKQINIREKMLNDILYNARKYIDYIEFIEKNDKKSFISFDTNISLKNFSDEKEVPMDTKFFINSLIDLLDFKDIKVHFVGLYFNENEIYIIEKGKEIKEYTIKQSQKDLKKIYSQIEKYFIKIRGDF